MKDNWFEYIRNSWIAGILLIIAGLYTLYDGLTMNRRESNELRSPLKGIIGGIGAIIIGILIIFGQW
jgi:uncharacterized membrane protein